MQKYITVDVQAEVLNTVICNGCGKEIEIKNGIAKEEFITIEHEWGYFSKKDGETHSFDLCEDCYDNLVRQLKIPLSPEGSPEMEGDCPL